MISKTRTGFTLIELLVVIAIIGVLVGLLVPAVNFARESGRRAQCLNNVRGIGQAMVQHETDKGAFPGRVTPLRLLNGDIYPVSWMTKLLPYLEQGNVLERIQDGTLLDSSTDSIQLEIATCPSDPPTAEIPFRLSYVVNCGISDYYFYNGDLSAWGAKGTDLAANGVCHIQTGNSSASVSVNLGYLAKNDGATNTLLVSENLNAVAWLTKAGSDWQGIELVEGLHGMVWTMQQKEWWQNPDTQESNRQYAFNDRFARVVPDTALVSFPPMALECFARPSSNHSGGVNAVFCDSHAIFLSDDIDPWVYNQLMSVSNQNARHRLTGDNWLQNRVPTQVDYQLSADDLL